MSETMTGQPAYATRVERIRSEHEGRARAELERAETLAPGSDVVRWSGAVIAEVALVKGCAGPAEAAGGAALSGADGEAADKALAALGWPVDAVFRTLSRPELTVSPDARAARLRTQLEAVGPLVVVALDRVAAEDVALAFGIEALAPSSPVVAGGRRLVAVDDFEASLVDERRKRRVWKQVQAARPDGPVF